MTKLKKLSGKLDILAAPTIGPDPKTAVRRESAVGQDTVLHRPRTRLSLDSEESISTTSAKRQPRIEWVDITELRPSPHNARTHSSRQIKQIQRSIGEFGFTNPVLIDPHMSCQPFALKFTLLFCQTRLGGY
jgi:hypothetical protein